VCRLSVPDDRQTADHRSTDTCKAYLGSCVKKPFSVIFTADPGEFSGVPEAHYIIANLVNRKNKPKNSTVCGGHYQGSLMGQPVLVVTTGTLCNDLAEVVYSAVTMQTYQ
jgi:hypothetical protein